LPEDRGGLIFPNQLDHGHHVDLAVELGLADLPQMDDVVYL
jgi:hypothetical protein